MAFLQRQSWYEPLRRAFWRDPDRLMATKATLTMACLAIPLVVAGLPFFAVSLALGALAGALSETDDHPHGRMKSMALKVLAFATSSLSVSLLHPYPVVLGVGLALSTVVYLLIGGLNERYRGVTFGTILVGVYAMIGASNSPAWYWQPLLLPLGALCYGLVSLAFLFLHPWRLLEEQLARGFLALSRYMELKASLFPTDERTQAKVRNQLALQNVKVVASLDQCRDVLNSYRESLPNDEPLLPYLRSFMLLQSLHERAASSHERYDLLSDDPRNLDLLEGIGQTLLQLSRAIRLYADSLLTQVPYRHPVSLGWLLNVLHEKLSLGQVDGASPLALLVTNLERSHRSLCNLGDDTLRTLAPRLASDPRTLWRRFVDQLSPNHPRMRHAVRLSLCFLIGFGLSEWLHLHKGEWIVLTCLFVLQPNYSETRRRLFQRIFGTLAGVVGGVLCVQILPTTPGELVFMLASAFFFFFWLKKNYSVAVIFITTFVLCAFNLVSKQGVALMLPRIIDTLIGAGLAYLSVRLLWPDWQHKRLPTLINTALRRNADYLGAVLEEYQRGSSGDDFNYRVARRAAHRADNALVLAWHDMQLEPSRTRHVLAQSFRLTYLNHALLSYISALGAHRQSDLGGESSLPPESATVLRGLINAATAIERGVCDPGCAGRMRALMDDLARGMAEAPGEVTRAQYGLLRNIAEITVQIMRQTTQVEG